MLWDRVYRNVRQNKCLKTHSVPKNYKIRERALSPIANIALDPPVLLKHLSGVNFLQHLHLLYGNFI